MKFLRTTFGWTEHEARMSINNPNFKAMESLGDGIYELSFSPSKVKLDLPIQIGIQILNLAKLRMLRFVYQFLTKFVEKSDYTFLQMDTDSLYLAISADTFEEVIKPCVREEYNKMIYGRCKEAPNGSSFLPRQCCKEDNFQDNYTPGIFKTEWIGDKMICLASKTYVGRDEDGADKLTCKGANKAGVRKRDAFNMFETVLTDREGVKTKNRGFRVVSGGISTYEQDKRCFPYFYCKREVKEDGVSTSTLKLTLNPVPISVCCIQTSVPILSMVTKHSFSYQGRRFINCLQAYVFMKAIGCTQLQYCNRVMAVSEEKSLWTIEKEIGPSNKWLELRYSVMEDIITNMINQIPRLKSALMTLPNLPIISAGVYECYFNCGVNKYVVRWLREGQIPGSNYYGKILSHIKER